MTSTRRAKPSGREDAFAPHSASVDEVLTYLNVDPVLGLDDSELSGRRARHGLNVLETARPKPAWLIFVQQFNSLVVALLAAAALVAWLTGDRGESLAIAVVLVINAAVGFLTEWQAGRALEALRREAHTRTRVRRQGHDHAVDAEDLVPGDIIVLEAGDRVPADSRIIRSSGLTVQESSLTGESVPVEKGAGRVDPEAPLAEWTSMLFLGTTVSTGHTVAVVTATGAATELGKIGKLVAGALEQSTPLSRELAVLGRRLVYVVLIIAVIVMLAGYLQGDGLWVMVEVGISLAVAAVPEAMPAVTTLILALGVLRMARQCAIVRRLSAVEALGSATVICTDKTGTLTENRIAVTEYALADGRSIHWDGSRHDIASDHLLARVLTAGVLCNTASLGRSGDHHAQEVGDPLEVALLSAARSAGIEIAQLRSEYPKVAEQPFDSDTKRMITVHQEPRSPELLFLMKGAPGVVLDCCSNYYVAGEGRVSSLDDAARASFLAVNESMASRALRVLAFAEKRIPAGGEQTLGRENDSDSDRPGRAIVSPDAKTGGYVFLGAAGMIDPPRKGVSRAIAEARSAGIRVVMLTGDQVKTAAAIAAELGIGEDGQPQAVHSRDIQSASSEELVRFARANSVFARVTPADKLRIVEAFQGCGDVVAVTGDGVNDAPALKRSDIGVAMGMRGTEVAKEAADVVLTDDNFATIVRAIESGRTIYSNIGKFVHLMFSKNLAEVIAIFIAIALGWPLPLLPLQILWMNLVTDSAPALALAAEPAAADIMRRPPRSPKSSLLSARFFRLISWQALMLSVIVLSAYYWALKTYGGGAHARTVALFVLIGVQLGHMFNCRSKVSSAFVRPFSNPFLWLAAGVVIGLQAASELIKPLARVLDVVPLSQTDWLVVGVATLLPIPIVELVKVFQRRSLSSGSLAR